jgi:hypothetical protein
MVKIWKLQEELEVIPCRVASSPMIRYHFVGIEGAHHGSVL